MSDVRRPGNLVFVTVHVHARCYMAPKEYRYTQRRCLPTPHCADVCPLTYSISPAHYPDVPDDAAGWNVQLVPDVLSASSPRISSPRFCNQENQGRTGDCLNVCRQLFGLATGSQSPSQTWAFWLCSERSLGATGGEDTMLTRYSESGIVDRGGVDCTSLLEVWYEWALSEPSPSPVQPPGKSQSGCFLHQLSPTRAAHRQTVCCCGICPCPPKSETSARRKELVTKQCHSLLRAEPFQPSTRSRASDVTVNLTFEFCVVTANWHHAFPITRSS